MFIAESPFVGSSLGFGRRVTHSKFLGEGLAGLAGPLEVTEGMRWEGVGDDTGMGCQRGWERQGAR